MNPPAAATGQRGFSMIEVLIALVVLAVGLLGLALLQTTNLRYTKSANLRTQAVNLGTELLDTIRANHTEVAAYAAGVQPAAITAAVKTAARAGCPTSATMTSAANIGRWNCEVVEALGEDATASVTVNANQVTVLVTWDDEFWITNTADKTAGAGAITLVSQL
ncbi:MAG: type IV pilus modification protein PilV [Lysobacter sp.]|nr:type IV pilus modification protein PilV [Lysobacter sp.]